MSNSGSNTSPTVSPKSAPRVRPPPPPPPPPPSDQNNNQNSIHRQNTMHQPHGAAAIVTNPSNVSSATSLISQQQQQQQQLAAQQLQVSLESPLPPMVQRGLGDRSNEKRKNAALEIEALIKSLQEAHNFSMVHSVIAVLGKDFCSSMNPNYRKGGLIGLAATAIGLMQSSTDFLNALLPPILHCFDDPESRVRYYACESLYNVAKVSRQAILVYFNQIFEGLTKLFADVDVDVKNGANLMDRLIKDIVTEADNFQVDQFLPLLQTYIRRTNPYIRQLIIGWITLLDSIPDISMLDYLADFLDGIFNMLSDSNREIRQAADSSLSEFLRELAASTVVEFGPIISVLVVQCQSKERLNRLTAITWLAESIQHMQGGDTLLPYHSDILSAIMWCISDGEKEIRLVAERTNNDMMMLVRETKAAFVLLPLLDTLTSQLLEKEDVPTKMAALRWINMLMEKRKAGMNTYTKNLLPVLLRTLSDPSDAVVLLDLQVLSRISLARETELGFVKDTEEAQFQLVLNAILNLFAEDRQLLETRGSLIIRKLCVLLNAKSVYIRMADTLSSFEADADIETLSFVSTMVQTLNLILLTASELHDLRSALANWFLDESHMTGKREGKDDGNVFATIFHCWVHNPVATFSLCLLASAHDLSFALIKRFAEMEDVSVGFLMQVDKLVHLLESPIFVHLRLQLLNVDEPYHAPLLKSIYGIIMCLPQGDAFRLLNERLQTVCNLRDTLGISASVVDAGEAPPIVAKRGLDMALLLKRFDDAASLHRAARLREQPVKLQSEHDPTVHDSTSALTNRFTHSPKAASPSVASGSRRYPPKHLNLSPVSNVGKESKV
jgi:vacuole morphology and inheritance protein 14